MTTHLDVPQGMERRMVVRLPHHWRELAGASRHYPERNELDPQAVGEPWPSCFVLDLTGDPDDPTVEYVGEALAALGGALEEGTPSSAIAPESLLADEPLLFRGILAPLGAEPAGLTHLLGAASARVGALS